MVQRKISVIGLGYVGLPVAVAFGQKHQVIAFDINEKRIEALKAGHDAIEWYKASLSMSKMQ